MASRFQGRDFQTLRQEIIDFVKEKAPDGWDSTNAADPMIRAIETIAMMGDHLHYYIDVMRRESDMATATLASSVYSYALREGYIMTLPRSTHYRINLYSSVESSIEGVELKKFDKVQIQNNQTLDFYVMTPLHSTTIYSQYPQEEEIDGNKVTVNSPEIEIVGGSVKEIRFTFSDIDYYSRIELPESSIDPSMCQLIAQSGMDVREIERVEDVVSDLAQANIYSLTPSFVHGVSRLYIEFPYNYRNLFPNNTTFVFKYLTIRKDPKTTSIFDFPDTDNLVGIIKTQGGYHEYEDPESIKQNYKYYVRDFTSLVTKFDYKSYVNWNINSRCQVFDKSDETSANFSFVPERTIYILSDLAYKEREALRDEILKRSSRSDNIFMIPYGMKQYRVLVIVEADLMAESKESIKSAIQASLTGYYNDVSEVRIPIESVIYHRIHNVNTAIKRAWVILIDETYIDGENERSNFPTSDIISTDPDDPDSELNSYINPELPTYNYIFTYFYNLLPNIQDSLSISKDQNYLDRYSDLEPPKEQVIVSNILTNNISRLALYKGCQETRESSYSYKYPTELPYPNVNEDLSLVDNTSINYYDSPDIDTQSVNSAIYKRTHFILPSLFDTIIWVYST